MNSSRRTKKNDHFLDVTQFIFTEHKQLAVPSPRLTPRPIQQHDVITPSNLPLIIEVQGVELSPYFQIGGQTLDIEFYDFTLEIPEENEENSNSQNQVIQEYNQSNESLQVQNLKSEQNENIYQSYIPEIPSARLNIKYFRDALHLLRKQKATDESIRQFMSDYLVEEDYQNIDFDNESLENIEELAKKNLRTVGPISWLERKYKLMRFKEKKKNRIWQKKISYDCRKKVADKRLRVKGKFVTKEQACNMLGVDQMQQQDLKQLLISRKSQNTK